MSDKEQFSDLDPLRVDWPATGRIGEVCPYLGLIDDPNTHALFVTDEHRCYANGKQSIVAHQQAELCMTAFHVSCPIAQAAQSAPASSPSGTSSSGARGRNRRVATIATVVVAVLLVGLGAVFAWRSWSNEDASGAAALVSETPTVELSAAVAQPPEAPAIVLHTATTTPTPEPTATVTSTPTLEPSPTVTPEPTATPVLRHVVAPGETLTGIATQYGLTADQLAAANGISANSVLYAGDSLSVPPR